MLYQAMPGKTNVFMVDLKFSKPAVALIPAGKSFYYRGTTVEKVQSPNGCCLVLGITRPKC